MNDQHIAESTVIEDPASSVKNSVKKKKMVVIIIVVLLLCCFCTAAFSVVYIFIKRPSDRSNDSNGTNNGNESGSTSSSSITETSISSSSSTATSSTFTTTQTTSSTVINDPNQPDISKVFDAMGELDSYTLTATITGEGEIYAQYQAPNREYVRETYEGDVNEEIAIGEDVYSRDNGGVWKKTDYVSLTGFHEELTNEKFWTEDFNIIKDGSSGEYWIYNAASPDGFSFKLYVYQDTNYIYKMDIFEGSISGGSMIFKDFNSENIKIEKPI
ncbi:MAG: hypothetical protein PHS44_05785 [Candidatus Dojkabacteria bacterium]|nr:hypothetical protein [Candidatus Dojkabacteria bacterium]